MTQYGMNDEDALLGSAVSPLVHERVRLAFHRHKARFGKGVPAIHARMHKFLGAEFEDAMSATTLYYFWVGKITTSARNIRLIYKYLRLSEPDIAIPLTDDLSLSIAGDALSRFFSGDNSVEDECTEIVKSISNSTFTRFERVSAKYAEPLSKSITGFHLNYRRTIADVMQFTSLNNTKYFKFVWLSWIVPREYIQHYMDEERWERYVDFIQPVESYRIPLEDALEEFLLSENPNVNFYRTGIALPIPETRQIIIISRDKEGHSSVMVASIFDQKLYKDEMPDAIFINRFDYEIYINSASHSSNEELDMMAIIKREMPVNEIESVIKTYFRDDVLSSSRISKTPRTSFANFAINFRI